MKSVGRNIWTASIASTLVLAVAACGSGSSPETTDDGEVTIRMALGGAADTYDPDPDNALVTALEEAVGADITTEAMPEDISASLAAGDSPDIFRVNRSQLETYLAQGLVLDLSQYQDQLPDYQAFVGAETVQQGTVDGQLSAITPFLNDKNYTTYWIRQDWLDQLGLPTPTTVEEFRDVLQAFTEQDPDGNGQNDTYGLTGASPYNTFLPLFGAFGTPGPKYIYVDDTGQVRSGYTDPGAEEAITYIADLQTSGFVDPDSYTLSASEARDRAFQGLAGVMSQSWASVTKPEFWDAAMAAQPDADWQQLDLFLTADSQPSSIALPASGIFYAVPASLEGDDAKIAKILELINYTATEEGNRLVCFGVEGVHYELGANGEIEPLPAMDEDGGYFVSYQVAGRDDEQYLMTKFVDQRPYIENAWAQATTPTYDTMISPPDGFNQADAERFAEDQIVQFLTGARPVSEYQDFVDTLNGQFGYSQLFDAAVQQLTDLGIAG